MNTENLGQFERTLIIVDEGAYVHYVEGCTAPIYKSDSLHAAVVEIVALDEHSMDRLDTLLQRFASVTGVEDVMVVPEERVAYLKVDRQRLDVEALAGIAGNQWQRTDA